jgi:L-seryl-tRNA(Ser) seleniumtransferase
MRVHASNYRVVGFASEVSIGELVRLGHARGLIVIDDIGSGALLDFSRYGCRGEPLARDSISAGADLVLFSGDKLLGGPQCGVLVGRKTYVARIRRHPMARAMRVGKLTLTALAATLRLYRDASIAEQRIPLLKLLSAPVENMKNRAERLAPQLRSCAAIGQADVVSDVAYLGGGALPAQELPTWCVALTPGSGNATSLARRLRMGTPPVVGRVQHERLLLDMRSVLAHQDIEIVAAVEALDK